MDRASSDADALYIRCHAGRDDEIFNWKIERALFFALEDPFFEMPNSGTDYQIFPQGANWYLHHHDTEPIIYLGGSADLLNRLAVALNDQFVPLELEDRYY